MSTYTIRPATLDERDDIIGLRAEAEQWLRQQGIRQWTQDYSDYARDVLTTSIQAGKTWLVCAGENIVATVTLNGPDPDFWDPEDDPETGLYLGKMIVTRAAAGRQIGDAILNWASQKAADAGKKWLRLDVRRDNERLHQYYIDRGFEHVRTVFPPRRRTESGAIFQRVAGSTTPLAQPTELCEQEE